MTDLSRMDRKPLGRKGFPENMNGMLSGVKNPMQVYLVTHLNLS